MHHKIATIIQEGGADRSYVAMQKYRPFVLIAVVLVIIVVYQIETNPQTKTAPPDNELAAILENIEGVGQVAVYFHTAQASSTEDFFQGYFTNESNFQEIIGVLIVCEGANNLTVQQQLKKTVSTVLQIPLHRIVIQTMEVKGEVQ